MALVFGCCQGAGYRTSKTTKKKAQLARSITLDRKVSALTDAERETAEDAREDAEEAKRAGVDISDRANATERQTQMYGYLFRGIRPQHFYYRLALYGPQLLYAIVAAFVSSSTVSVFVLGATCCLQALFIVLFLPFRSFLFNFWSALLCLASVAHALIMLGIQLDAESAALLLPLAAFALVVLVLLVSRKRIANCCRACRVALEDNEGREDEWKEEEDEDEEEEADDDDDGEGTNRKGSSKTVPKGIERHQQSSP
jgi:hypothetical protein